MTIIEVVDIGFRPENGWREPNYPMRIWQVSGEVTGDGSGGFMALQINLKSANAQIGNAFSLEQLSVIQSEIGAGNPDMGIDGFETPTPGLIISQWAVPVTPVDQQTTDMLDIDRRVSKFLGQGSSPTGSATLTFTLGNQNTETLGIVALGYMWSPRSIMQGSGGYRRPPDGIFGV